jgi:hypothetical protein
VVIIDVAAIGAPVKGSIDDASEHGAKLPFIGISPVAVTVSASPGKMVLDFHRFRWYVISINHVL